MSRPRRVRSGQSTLAVAGAAVVVLCASQLCHAAAIVRAGVHELLPNTPDQHIVVGVTGASSDRVQGLNLNVMIGDGGPELSDYGLAAGTPGPAITAVSIDGPGTLFEGNSTGAADLDSLPQLAMWITTTEEGTVEANGILALLTIDTTGFQTGAWSLSLGDTINGPTDFAGIAPAEFHEGSITITSVPEPTAMLISSLWLTLLFHQRQSHCGARAGLRVESPWRDGRPSSN